MYTLAIEPPCGGVMIGTLPTLEHDVSGDLFVEDSETFCIQDFTYDGRGPGMPRHLAVVRLN